MDNINTVCDYVRTKFEYEGKVYEGVTVYYIGRKYCEGKVHVPLKATVIFDGGVHKAVFMNINEDILYTLCGKNRHNLIETTKDILRRKHIVRSGVLGTIVGSKYKVKKLSYLIK